MTKAEEIVRNEFERSYKYSGNVWAEDGSDSTMVCTVQLFYYYHSLNLQKDPCETAPAPSLSKNIFDNLPSLEPSASETMELGDELAKYLSTPRDLNAKDGLRWWYERKHLYPCLHRMALDYLSIPGKLFVFQLCDGLLTDTHMISQPRRLMLNEHSARAASCSHMYAIGYRFNQHAPFCVSEHGVY